MDSVAKWFSKAWCPSIVSGQISCCEPRHILVLDLKIKSFAQFKHATHIRKFEVRTQEKDP